MRQLGFVDFKDFERVFNMPAGHYTLQNHNPGQLENLAAFIERYLKTFPDAKLLSAGFYTYHPAVENGMNVFLALDAEGQVRGFAPLFPAPVTQESGLEDPHHIWMILLADPEAGDGQRIRELLLERVIERASSIAAGFPLFAAPAWHLI
jgi:hypothetical protein